MIFPTFAWLYIHDYAVVVILIFLSVRLKSIHVHSFSLKEKK